MLDQSIREYIWLRGSHATTTQRSLQTVSETKRDKFVLFQFGLAPCFQIALFKSFDDHPC